MLKTLEEPPEHVKFILATTDPQRLPVTVLSRCLQFNLKPLSPALIAGHLKHVLAAEGVAFEEAALLQLAKAAAGSLRDSLSLLDQAIAHGGGKVTAAQVAEMLGSLGGDLVWPLLERIVEGDGKGTIAEAERIAARSISFDTALEDLAAILHRIALAQAGAAPAGGRSRCETRDRDGATARRGPRPGDVPDRGAGRRDLSLAPDEFAGFTMALLRMLSFADVSAEPRAVASKAPAEKMVARQPVRAAASDVAPASPTPASASFDGDWPGLVERLRLTGMAGMAAKYAEFVTFANNHLELVVPDSHKMYAEKPYLEKLKAELASAFRSLVPAHRARGRHGGARAWRRRSRARWPSARRAPPKPSRKIPSCASWCAISAPKWCLPPFVRPTKRRASQPATRGDDMMKGGLGALMKQAQQMQENMKKAQEELAKIEVEGQSGAGLVKVVMTCKFAVKKVTIDPSLLGEDKDMLEDLVMAAMNDAVAKAEAATQAKMAGFAAGLNLPPGMNLPGF